VQRDGVYNLLPAGKTPYLGALGPCRRWPTRTQAGRATRRHCKP